MLSLARDFWYVFYIVAFFLGLFLRNLIVNKIIIYRNKTAWEEFNNLYGSIEYEDERLSFDDD